MDKAEPATTEVSVREIMSAPVLSLTQSQSLPLAEELMKQQHIRHIPVVA